MFFYKNKDTFKLGIFKVMYIINVHSKHSAKSKNESTTLLQGPTINSTLSESIHYHGIIWIMG
jgi:hypothetical protein